MIKSRIEGVCVFCGSRLGNKREFSEAAVQLGQALALYNYKLVYGAGDIGLMGDLSKACEKAGGDILGVMPEKLTSKEVGRKSIKSFVITEDMHERKKVMYMNSDAIIALPGGLGTLEELFEMMTWKQLGFHNKPIYLLNILGFWDNILSALGDIINLDFADSKIFQGLKVCDSVDEIFLDLKKVVPIESSE
jgi:uncharacterized protein (TIGR00730 family)